MDQTQFCGRWLWQDFTLQDIKSDIQVNGLEAYCAPTDVDPQSRPWIEKGEYKNSILKILLLPAFLTVSITAKQNTK